MPAARDYVLMLGRRIHVNHLVGAAIDDRQMPITRQRDAARADEAPALQDHRTTCCAPLPGMTRSAYPPSVTTTMCGCASKAIHAALPISPLSVMTLAAPLTGSTFHEVRHTNRFNIFGAEMLDIQRQPWT
jgi:hypothetical protein